jgi:hypothetical protein
MSIQLSFHRVFSELKEALLGEVVSAGHPLYEKSVKLWNAAVHTRPALIALCTTDSDVASAVRIAGKYQWNLTVRAGGHDWSGLALSENGLVIDLSNMRKVMIDADKKAAILQGGATAGDLLAAADPYNLVAVTGAGSTIGMAGLIMGGGYGPLTPKYGLALDNLISATLVMADGNMLTASETENADLFWAIRGGGGNFGVVVSMRVRLHDAASVLSAQFLYPLQAAPGILMFCNEYARTAPDDLSMITGIIPGPDGETVVIVALTWCGEITAGEYLIAAFTYFQKPLSEKVQQLRYKDLLAEFDTFVTQGNCNDMKTRWLKELKGQSLDIILKAGAKITSGLSTITMQYCYGRAAKLPLDSTAFGLREPHILVLITSTWTPDDDVHAETHRRWSRDLCADLADDALPGGYPNVLTKADIAQVQFAYGDNLQRLRTVKSHYDPHQVFNSYPF